MIGRPASGAVGFFAARQKLIIYRAASDRP